MAREPLELPAKPPPRAAMPLPSLALDLPASCNCEVRFPCCEALKIWLLIAIAAASPRCFPAACVICGKLIPLTCGQFVPLVAV